VREPVAVVEAVVLATKAVTELEAVIEVEAVRDVVVVIEAVEEVEAVSEDVKDIEAEMLGAPVPLLVAGMDGVIELVGERERGIVRLEVPERNDEQVEV
jgi:hypothetical protein